MKPIVLSESTIFALKTIEDVLEAFQSIGGRQLRIRDCTMKAEHSSSRSRTVLLKGHFYFPWEEGESIHTFETTLRLLKWKGVWDTPIEIPYTIIIDSKESYFKIVLTPDRARGILIGDYNRVVNGHSVLQEA